MAKWEGDILFKWMGNNNIKPRELADLLGITKQIVYLRIKDEVIPDVFKMKLSMASYTIPELGVKPFDSRKINFTGIPLIPLEAIAGMLPGELVIKDSDIENRYFVPEFSKADFLIRVKGSSMYPKYTAGDILACIKAAKTDFIQWNKTYVIDTTQGVLVKRILKGKDDKHWILRSDNKDYQDIDVNTIKDVRHINLVIGVIRLE